MKCCLRWFLTLYHGKSPFGEYFWNFLPGIEYQAKSHANLDSGGFFFMSQCPFFWVQKSHRIKRGETKLYSFYRPVNKNGRGTWHSSQTCCVSGFGNLIQISWTLKSSIISKLLELWAANPRKKPQKAQSVPFGSNVQKWFEQFRNIKKRKKHTYKKRL